MSETKPIVTLSLYLLARVDYEKAYKLGLEIGKDKNIIYQGIFAVSLANPYRDVEYLAFIAYADAINGIVEKVKLGLNLDRENLQLSATPYDAPKEKLPPSDMST
jgi:hypothetical protein